MALPNVAQGQPHVSAHNAERNMMNDMQAVIDEDFLDNLRLFLDDENVIVSAGIRNIVAITQAAYDALTPKVATTFYLIIES